MKKFIAILFLALYAGGISASTFVTASTVESVFSDDKDKGKKNKKDCCQKDAASCSKEKDAKCCKDGAKASAGNENSQAGASAQSNAQKACCKKDGDAKCEPGKKK